MYRNCPEHPMINEILRNGEPIEAKGISRKERRNLALSEEQISCLTERDFEEICLRRKSKKAATP